MAWSIAHRGGRGLWPENTLFAFRHAIDIGCNGAELDVQLTRDGALVITHDFRLNPDLARKEGQWWRGPEMRIHDCTFEELRPFDIGRSDPQSEYAKHWPHVTPHDGERVPLFSEILDMIGDRDFHLLVEIKTAWNDRVLSAPPKDVTDATVKALRKHHFFDRATLVSFDWIALLHARRIESSLPCWFLTLPPGNDGWRRQSEWAAGFEPSKYPSVPAAIAAAGGQGWLSFFTDATTERVAEAHRFGLKVGVWNINDAAFVPEYVARGVDAICSDYPDRLVTAARA